MDTMNKGKMLVQNYKAVRTREGWAWPKAWTMRAPKKAKRS